MLDFPFHSHSWCAITHPFKKNYCEILLLPLLSLFQDVSYTNYSGLVILQNHLNLHPEVNLGTAHRFLCSALLLKDQCLSILSVYCPIHFRFYCTVTNRLTYLSASQKRGMSLDIFRNSVASTVLSTQYALNRCIWIRMIERILVILKLFVFQLEFLHMLIKFPKQMPSSTIRNRKCVFHSLLR